MCPQCSTVFKKNSTNAPHREALHVESYEARGPFSSMLPCTATVHCQLLACSDRKNIGRRTKSFPTHHKFRLPVRNNASSHGSNTSYITSELKPAKTQTLKNETRPSLCIGGRSIYVYWRKISKSQFGQRCPSPKNKVHSWTCSCIPFTQMHSFNVRVLLVSLRPFFSKMLTVHGYRSYLADEVWVADLWERSSSLQS